LPQGSELLQDLGFLAFTLDGVVVSSSLRHPLVYCQAGLIAY